MKNLFKFTPTNVIGWIILLVIAFHSYKFLTYPTYPTLFNMHLFEDATKYKCEKDAATGIFEDFIDKQNVFNRKYGMRLLNADNYNPKYDSYINECHYLDESGNIKYTQKIVYDSYLDALFNTTLFSGRIHAITKKY